MVLLSTTRDALTDAGDPGSNPALGKQWSRDYPIDVIFINILSKKNVTKFSPFSPKIFSVLAPTSGARKCTMILNGKYFPRFFIPIFSPFGIHFCFSFPIPFYPRFRYPFYPRFLHSFYPNFRYTCYPYVLYPFYPRFRYTFYPRFPNPFIPVSVPALSRAIYIWKVGIFYITYILCTTFVT